MVDEPKRSHELKNYVDNTGLHKLLPLMRDKNTKVSLRSIDSSMWGLLDIFVLSDVIITNNFEPKSIGDISNNIIEQFITCFENKELPIKGLDVSADEQKKIAKDSAFEVVLILKKVYEKNLSSGPNVTLSSEYQVIKKLENMIYDLKPRFAGVAAWDEFWKMSLEELSIRNELAEMALNDMASGFLFFWCILT